MRLFDHLATGHPIISTNACVQVRNFVPIVRMANTHAEFLSILRDRLEHPCSEAETRLQLEEARENLWSSRASLLARTIANHLT